MAGRQDLERLRQELSELDDSLAEKVAELEATEEKIAKKRAAKQRHSDDQARRDEIAAQIEHLLERRKFLKGRRNALEGVIAKTCRRIKRTRRQIRNAVSPKVIDLGFDRTAVRPLSRQGTIYGSVGHYTAGPLDDDGDDESIALWRAYDRAHKAQGWAALGYNIGVTRLGTVVRLRGVEYVGAHTLNSNESWVGISVHGTTGHTWTKAQKRGLRKALKKWGLSGKPVIGHHEAPGQSTACPGAFLAGYKSKGK